MRAGMGRPKARGRGTRPRKGTRLSASGGRRAHGVGGAGRAYERSEQRAFLRDRRRIAMCFQRDGGVEGRERRVPRRPRAVPRRSPSGAPMLFSLVSLFTLPRIEIVRIYTEFAQVRLFVRGFGPGCAG